MSTVHILNRRLHSCPVVCCTGISCFSVAQKIELLCEYSVCYIDKDHEKANASGCGIGTEKGPACMLDILLLLLQC